MQSVSGFGAALVAIPILALAVGPAEAVVVATLVSLVLSCWAAVREREHVDVPIARRMTIAGVVGMPAGLALLVWSSEGVLRVLMAVTVLVALVLVATKVRVSGGAVTGDVTGVLSGVLLTSTGMNGPPLVLGLYAQRPEPRRFRGTLQAVLGAQDVVAVVGFVLVGRVHPPMLVAAAIGLVCCPLGWLVGDLVFDRIPARAFHLVLSVGLAASALMLVLGDLG